MNAFDATMPRYHSPQPQRQKPVKSGTWLPAEDKRLCEAVANYGTRWVAVANDVGSRNSDQCAKRWTENLNPELNHGPWSQNEDQRLLNLVDMYGNNWKFIASNFLSARAPLALKNRHTLLIRRLKRQGTLQQQQKTANSDGTKSLRHATNSRSPSGSASHSAMSTIDLTGLFDDCGDLQSPQTDGAATSNIVSNFSPSKNPFGADMAFTGDAIAANDQLVWAQQQHLFSDAGMELESVPFDIDPIMRDLDLEQPTIMTDNNTGSRDVSQIEESGTEGSNAGISAVETAELVEYSITCQRGKVKTLVNHLLDVAMSETTAPMAENDKVTVTIQVKG